MKKKTRPAITPQLLPAPGARVGSVDGPGRFPKDNAGTVLCHVSDRWGTHALVLMDAGATNTVHGLTDVGIGWHLIAGQAWPVGYTEQYEVSSAAGSARILVKPDADLDGTVQVWDIDAGQFVGLHGWLWRFERIDMKSAQDQDCGPENS